LHFRFPSISQSPQRSNAQPSFIEAWSARSYLTPICSPKFRFRIRRTLMPHTARNHLSGEGRKSDGLRRAGRRCCCHIQSGKRQGQSTLRRDSTTTRCDVFWRKTMHVLRRFSGRRGRTFSAEGVLSRAHVCVDQLSLCLRAVQCCEEQPICTSLGWGHRVSSEEDA
jgi:hypothetical protein